MTVVKELKPDVAKELTVKISPEDIQVFNNVFQAGIEKFSNHRQSVANIISLEQKLAKVIEPHIEQSNGN